MERFALTITREEVDIIVNEIDSFINKPIRITENGNSFHIVNISGTELVVLYDWEYETPLTVCFLSWFTKISDWEYELKPRWKQKDLKIYDRAKTFTVKTGIRSLKKSLG